MTQRQRKWEDAEKKRALARHVFDSVDKDLAATLTRLSQFLQAPNTHPPILHEGPWYALRSADLRAYLEEARGAEYTEALDGVYDSRFQAFHAKARRYSSARDADRAVMDAPLRAAAQDIEAQIRKVVQTRKAKK